MPDRIGIDKDDDDYNLPHWISDKEIDPKWIEQATGVPANSVATCVVQDISNAGRRQVEIKNGATLKLTISYTNNMDDHHAPMSLIIKQAPPVGRPQSKMLGLAREGLFYKHLAPKVTAAHPHILPKIYRAFGDMASGSKLVLMEDLSASSYVDSGILFGPGNPNNWSRDLPNLISQAYGDGDGVSPPSSYQVANETFLAIAKVHATFWKDESLLSSSSSSYLRCANWIQGQDRASWAASQGFIQGIWKKLNDNGAMDTVIEWDPLVRACTTKAMAGISWEAQLERLNTAKSSSHWTLVHGDFWPGNVLISTDTTSSSSSSSSSDDSSSLKLLDWEMAGIGSGAQDLGQYVLSNMDPEERRACERTLIEHYYEELIRCGVPKESYSLEDCWNEYRIGGIERWLWFLVYFIGQEGPMLKWAQFFHDQIQAFLVDHKITPDDIVQPRP